MKNEKTSRRIARLAAKILTADDLVCAIVPKYGARLESIPVKDIRSIAASCLTQAPDKKRK